MEVNLDVSHYIFPMESFDLRLLSLRSRYQNSATSNKTLPIWSASKANHGNTYCEFTVHSVPFDEQDKEDSDSECEENKTMQICHICNIAVPNAYFKKHCDTDKHKRCLQIIENSMERLQKHARSVCISNENHQKENCYFCINCCILIKKKHKKAHNLTTLHQAHFEYDHLISILSDAFTLKENAMTDIIKTLSEKDDLINIINKSETGKTCPIEMTEHKQKKIFENGEHMMKTKQIFENDQQMIKTKPVCSSIANIKSDGNTIANTEIKPNGRTIAKSRTTADTIIKPVVSTNANIKPDGNTIANIEIKPDGNAIDIAEIKPNGNASANTELKPNGCTIADSRTTADTNIKPVVRTIANTEIKPDGNAIANAEIKADGNTIADTKTKPDGNTIADTKTKPDGNTIADAEIKPDGNAIANAEIKRDGNAIVKAEIKPDGNTIASTEIKSDVNTLADIISKPDGNAIANVEIKPGGNAIANAEIKADGNTIADNKTKPDGNTIANAEIKPGGNAIASTEIKADGNTIADNKTKPDGNTIANAEIKPGSNAIASTEIKADGNTIADNKTKPDGNTIANAEIKPDGNAIVKAEIKPDGNTIASTEIKADGNTIADTKIKSDVNTLADIISKPDGNAIANVEIKPGGNAIANAEIKPGSNAIASTEIKADGNTIADTKTKPDGNTIANAEIKPGGNAIASTEIKADGNTIADTKTKPDGNTIANAEIKPDGNSIANAEIKPDGNANAEIQPDSSTIADTKTEPDGTALDIESKQPVSISENERDLLKPTFSDMGTFLNNMKMGVTVATYNGCNPGAILSFPDGTKVRVSIYDLHGLYLVNNNVQCRLCRVLVECEEEHIASPEHMQRLETPFMDVHCIRKLDSIWYHCTICNDFLENIEMHITGAIHISMMKKATIAIPPNAKQPKSIVPNVHPEIAAITEMNSSYCKYCNIELPKGKQGLKIRKHHYKMTEHKYKVWLSEKDSKVHYHLQESKKSSNEVICKICEVSIGNNKEEIDHHLTALDHETKHKWLLEDNFITKVDDLLVNCDVCKIFILFFEELDHISSTKHISQVLIRRNATNSIIEEIIEDTNMDLATKNSVISKTVEVSEKQAKILENALYHVNQIQTKQTLQNESQSCSATVKKIVHDNNLIGDKRPEPNVSANFAHWLNFNQFTKAKQHDDVYYCNCCQVFSPKHDLLEHSNKRSHQINTGAVKAGPVHDAYYNCEICKKKVPNVESSINEHVNGKNHMRQASKHDNKVSKPQEGQVNVAQNSKIIQDNLADSKKISDEILNKNVAGGLKFNVNSAQMNSKNIKPCALLEIPSTFKDPHKSNALNLDNNLAVKLNNKKNSKSSDIVTNKGYDLMEQKDIEVYCILCKTQVPKSRIDDHFDGKRHAKNYKDLIETNKFLVRKNSYFCELCSVSLFKVNALKHIESTEHQTAKLATTAASTNENFCGLCLVGLNGDAAKKEHYESIRHKANLTAFKDERYTLSRLSTAYPFKTIPNSDKVLCNICDIEVVGIKKDMEKHISNKSHSERLLVANLNNLTYLQFKENLIKHQVHDRGNNAYYCRLCRLVLDGKWRAEIHILGQQHLKLLAESNKSESGNVKDESAESFAANLRNETVNEAGFSDTSEFDTKEPVSNTSLYFDAESELDIASNSIRSANSSVVDNWLELAVAEDDVHTKKHTSEKLKRSEDCGRVTQPASSSSVKKNETAEVPEKGNSVPKLPANVKPISSTETMQASAAKDIIVPEGFRKTDNPNELYCLRCKVRTQFNNQNIKSHVQGSIHKNLIVDHFSKKQPLVKKISKIGSSYTFIRQSGNPKQVICTICTYPSKSQIEYIANLAKDIDLHLKDAKHKEKLEKIIDCNNIVRSSNSCVCVVCIARFDETQLVEHVSSRKHLRNLNETGNK